MKACLPLDPSKRRCSVNNSRTNLTLYLKPMNVKPIQYNDRHAARHRTGFTLVELLVVLAIIAVLAMLSFSAIGRMRIAAAKSKGISQMRNIGLGIASWMGDNSSPEPFFMSDGTGDYPHESRRYSNFRPGNPAMALYQSEDPAAGYVQDFNAFFSPLAKLGSAAPTLSTYDPTKASETRLWGTYHYHYPHVTDARMTPRQRALGVTAIAASRESINGNLVLSEFYRDDWCPPKYGKRIYHALLSDGSVRYVADNDGAWGRWRTGN